MAAAAMDPENLRRTVSVVVTFPMRHQAIVNAKTDLEEMRKVVTLVQLEPAGMHAKVALMNIMVVITFKYRCDARSNLFKILESVFISFK